MSLFVGAALLFACSVSAIKPSSEAFDGMKALLTALNCQTTACAAYQAAKNRNFVGDCPSFTTCVGNDFTAM